MKLGGKHLVNEGITQTIAEGGTTVITSLSELIKEVIDEGLTFDLENDENIQALFVKSGLESATAHQATEEYLAEDFDGRLKTYLGNFDPENNEKNEVIYGNKEADEIKIPLSVNQTYIVHGYKGNDIIDATESQAAYNHMIKGDSGADLIIGGHSDNLMGGTGNDTIDASNGGGSNKLYGHEDDDVLIGGENDILHGRGGSDELYAGSGNTLTGGTENDTFWLVSNTLPDKTITVTDFTLEEDVIALNGLVEFEDLVFTEINSNTEVGINDDETVQLLATFLSISAEDLNNPDNFVSGVPLEPTKGNYFGTPNADFLQLSNEFVEQRVFAGDGDDVVDATSAYEYNLKNIVYGGLGHDMIIAGSGDILLGNEGDDAFYITSGGDNILTGGSGADQFWITTAEYPASLNEITDFKPAEDILGIGGLELEFEDLSLTQVDQNTIVAIGSNGLELANLIGVTPELLVADNFVFV